MSFKASGPKTRPSRVKPVPVPLSESRRSSVSSTASFTSAVEDQDGDAATAPAAEPVHFSPQEEEQMKQKSWKLKSSANTQFAHKDYSSALSTYDKALAELPAYLDYELAVLQSNIAACYLQLTEFKDAIEAADRGLERLEREWPMPKPDKKDKDKDKGKDKKPEEVSKIVELPEENDDDANAEMLRKLDLSDQRKADITRIRTKLLLRRARARVMLSDEPSKTQNTSTFAEAGDTIPSADVAATPLERHQQQQQQPPKSKPPLSTWANLSGALDDYHTLAQPEFFRTLPASDQKTVLDALRSLPPKVEAAKKKEVDEMMGKLKALGNGILRPFGLSTDMFKMVQDPSTGGWSMNFDGKAKK